MCAVTDFTHTGVIGLRETVNEDLIFLGPDLADQTNTLTHFGRILFRRLPNPLLYDPEYLAQVLRKRYPGKTLYEVVKEKYKFQKPDNAAMTTTIAIKMDDRKSPENYSLEQIIKPETISIPVNEYYSLFDLCMAVLGRHMAHVDDVVRKSDTTQFSPDLMVELQTESFFNFLRDLFRQERRRHLKENPPPDPLIFIKTNFTEPVIVGDRMDRIIFVTSAWRYQPMHHQAQTTVMYVPVVSNYINSMHFEFNDYEGRHVIFKPESVKTSYLTLHFKKV